MGDRAREVTVVVRGLWRSPAFSSLVVLTLALGIGATAAIFAVVDAVLLRPLGYPAAERLVVLDHPVPGQGPGARWSLSAAGYFHFADEMGALGRLGAFSSSFHNLTGDGSPERVASAAVTASLLEVLGARAVAGRLITEADDDPGAPTVALLSHALWQRRFGGDAAIVGRSIRVDGEPITVIGVVGPDFDLPDRTVDLWTPLALDRAAPPQNSHYLRAIGRLIDGATAQDAGREMERLTRRLPELFPEAYPASFMQSSGFSADVRPLRSTVVGDVERALQVVLGGVVLVLAIALANASNLLLVRAERRSREVALRSALGAGRKDLIRQFMVEGLVLASIAAALGLVLAAVGLDVLVALAPPDLPRLDEVGMGARTLWVTLGVVVVSGTLFGAIPSLRARTTVPAGALGEGGHGRTAGRRVRRVREGLVMAQIAFALVLVTGAGLMLQSFRRLSAVDPGFDAAGLLTFRLTLPASDDRDADDVYAVQREILARLGTGPGVASVAAIDALPITGDDRCIAVSIGDASDPRGTGGCPQVRFASPGYFEAMGIEVLEGREFTRDDNEARTAPLVVSRAMADRLWPGEPVLGQGVRLWGEGFYRVVGVVDDVRDDGPVEPSPALLYFPIRAAPGESMPPLNAMSFVVRGLGSAEVAPTLRDLVASVDPSLPLAEVRSMEEIVSRSMIRVTFTLLLLGIAGALALALGLVGMYAVASYAVAQRTGEFGIRMALGARASSIRAMVLREMGLTAVGGAALGLVLAWAGLRLLGALLYEVSATDPGTFAAATAALVTVSLLAAWMPARRATGIDPSEALRAGL